MRTIAEQTLYTCGCGANEFNFRCGFALCGAKKIFATPSTDYRPHDLWEWVDFVTVAFLVYSFSCCRLNLCSCLQNALKTGLTAKILVWLPIAYGGHFRSLSKAIDFWQWAMLSWNLARYYWLLSINLHISNIQWQRLISIACQLCKFFAS